MANAIRNLQLFRNGTPLVGNADYAKTITEQALNSSGADALVLSDGEPIIVRYQETQGGEVKGVYGVAYINGNVKSILWTSGEVSVVSGSDEGDYVTINITENPDGTFTVSATTNVVAIDDATEQNDGLVTAYDVKQHLSGVGVYNEGHDIDFRTEQGVTGQYIDTALDADIHVAGLSSAVGGVDIHDTFTAGMSLSEVLRKIFVKDVDVTPKNPKITFNMSDSTVTYEYGSAVSKTMSVSNYIDGYFESSNKTAYPDATFNTNNNTTNGKLDAGCVKGTETYSATSGTVSSATWSIDHIHANVTLTATVPYAESTVTAKTLANQNSTQKVAAGSLTPTKDIKCKYRIYVGVIDGTDFSSGTFTSVSSAISALTTNNYKGEWLDGNGYYREGANTVTQAASTSDGGYTVARGKSLVVLTETSKTITATYDNNADAGTFETQAVTRTIDGESVNYKINWLSNVSSDAAMVLFNLKVQ